MMNWTLILSLSLLGAAMGGASVFGWTRGIEFWCWLFIAILCAWIIGTRLHDRRFLHGFLTGLLMGVFNGIAQVTFFETYLANNPEIASQFHTNPTPVPTRFFALLMSPVIGSIYGLLLGAMSWTEGRIVSLKEKAAQRRSAPPAP
jgi:hypothetical protein